MANFPTHIAIGTVASGMLATLTMAANVVPAEELVPLLSVGALASVLPDIDLSKSRASDAMFAGLGVFVAFTLLMRLFYRFSIAEMWIIWVGTYLFIRYGAQKIFHNYARHRGIFHSLLAAAFFSFMTVIIFSKLFFASETVSWAAGMFMFSGYVVHLVLDEIYSVDVTNDKIVKASFGTALKVFDSRYKVASVAMAAAMALAFFFTPPAKSFVSTVASRDMLAFLNHRLLPEGKWFGFLTDFSSLAHAPPSGRTDIISLSPAQMTTPAPKPEAVTQQPAPETPKQ
ncbi:MAG: metal-dependent hydrolase [Hyphomicrobiaceae bacterium]|nr:MAG: metal-dependent hydrolase [Hyphomicrobiaceae bacterium]